MTAFVVPPRTTAGCEAIDVPSAANARSSRDQGVARRELRIFPKRDRERIASVCHVEAAERSLGERAEREWFRPVGGHGLRGRHSGTVRGYQGDRPTAFEGSRGDLVGGIPVSEGDVSERYVLGSSFETIAFVGSFWGFDVGEGVHASLPAYSRVSGSASTLYEHLLRIAREAAACGGTLCVRAASILSASR